MDDLAGMISQVLNDPAQMQQLQEIASSLGLSADGKNPPEPQPGPSEPVSSGAGFDLSALTALLNGNQQPSPSSQSPDAQQPDLSQLSSLLSGLVQSAPSPPQTAQPEAPLAGIDLSALSGIIDRLTGKGGATANGNSLSTLTSLLGNNQPPQQNNSPPFDMSTLLKLQQAMSSVGNNQANIQLLRALQPRLKEKRAKKVDDAIRVMQLIQFLPLIKESGLFGDMEGGLGGIVNSIGGGIEHALGGLLGRGRPG